MQVADMWGTNVRVPSLKLG